ncbi:hypothetical protein BV22DRAFT_1113952 [Leucogyrophana mollusca]|uniref:Uncharacterized protein n=1 Tax=Leucogyrophana mollusca TaxID=85980 RepID=A0ACB8BBI8_9AGAM|nr:hypothetical protein BV22DRAFT_1113952 [Leucogyrophana mollusca]
MSSPIGTTGGAAQKKRVAIVGAGAAGMSAAYAMSLHPDRFLVTVFEQSSSAGGMATSIPVNQSAYGATYINDGVQGASPVFFNTYAMFDRLGFKASPVRMQVSFGRDKEKEFWSNVFPSRVIDRFGPDIKKFGKVLRIIKALEPLFALISVRAMLKIFRFSKDFGEVIVYPLVALFFGTGNQTPFISSAILERVFMDPSMRLFEYSPDSFLASIPEMCSFPRLSLLYSAWTKEVTSRGNVVVRTERQVTRVIRGARSAQVEPTIGLLGKDGKRKINVQLWSRSTSGVDNSQQVKEPTGKEEREEFDELVMAVDADSALKILGLDAGWMERRVLGNVKYLWDISVTHNDVAYMNKYYRLKYAPSLNSTRTDEEARKGYEFAEKEFAPLYFIRSYPGDREKVEMSFDLTNYQAQFKGETEYGPRASEDAVPPPGSPPVLEKHIFQTIFLDHDGTSDKWSRGDIAKDKVISEKWWKQQSHRWQHYAGTVPWMMAINGKNHTVYAGAWTVLNMHEIAVVSGLAAAYQLGADYPFKDNEDCKRLFRLCLGASHASRMRAKDRKGVFV